jgi:DNA-binding transcriptional ArsR family regulator
MDSATAVMALGALAQETRLQAFRLLVQAGPEGRSAGALAEVLGVPPTTLSFHLSQLLRANLATQRRLGRQQFYAADYATMNGLLEFLTENCCGRGAACGPACDPAAERRESSQETEPWIRPNSRT